MKEVTEFMYRNGVVDQKFLNEASADIKGVMGTTKLPGGMRDPVGCAHRRPASGGRGQPRNLAKIRQFQAATGSLLWVELSARLRLGGSGGYLTYPLHLQDGRSPQSPNPAPPF